MSSARSGVVRIAVRCCSLCGIVLIPFTGTDSKCVCKVFPGNSVARKDTVMNENILDQNKELTRKFYDECWNQGQVEHLDQYVAKDCRYHDPAFPALKSGITDLESHITMSRKAFPDLRFS